MNEENQITVGYGAKFLKEVRKVQPPEFYFDRTGIALIQESNTLEQFQEALLVTKYHHLLTDPDPAVTFKQLQYTTPWKKLSPFAVARKRKPIDPNKKIHYGNEFMKALALFQVNSDCFTPELWSSLKETETREEFRTYLKKQRYYWCVYVYPDPRDTVVEIVKKQLKSSKDDGSGVESFDFLEFLAPAGCLMVLVKPLLILMVFYFLWVWFYYHINCLWLQGVKGDESSKVKRMARFFQKYTQWIKRYVPGKGSRRAR